MIDHDYNYLTSLEREFDKADRDATARGFLLDEMSAEGRVVRGNPMKGEVAMKVALERCGVIVARAPKGMSRAKANHTQWHRKQRRLAWTVEWVHPDGRKEERECAEDRPLSEAYAELCEPKEGYVTRKKRKIAKGESCVAQNGKEGSPCCTPSDLIAKDVSEASPSLDDILAEPGTREAIQTNHNGSASGDLSNVAERAPTESSSMGTNPPPSQISASENLGGVQNSKQPSPVTQQSPCKPPSPFRFYLHAPSLPSKETVLVPVEQSAILACCLRNRLVLEFPSIYVFNINDKMTDGNCTPDGFISEEEFFARAKKLLVEEVEEENAAENNKDIVEEKNKIDIDRFGRDFNAERVLKVLGEDLKSFG